MPRFLRAIAKSLSIALLSILIPQPLLLNADYRWEKGSRVSFSGVLAVRERDLRLVRYCLH
jgi:hypothetical protein